MSNSQFPDYPAQLDPTYWLKKTGSMPTGSDLPDKLKALKRKHEAVDSKMFEAKWPDGATALSALDDLYAKRESAYRGSLLPAKRDALAVSALAKTGADKFKGDKKLADAAKDAAKDIAKAVNAYCDAIDAGLDQLKQVYDAAVKALPKESPKDLPKPSKEAPKLSPIRIKELQDDLESQLKLCKKNAELKMNFAFVDKSPEQPAVLMLHKRIAGMKLLSELKTEAGIATGTRGSAWIDGTTLMLQIDTAYKGLAKKVRGPVKASGFKITRAVVWDEKGLEIPEEDDGEDAYLETKKEFYPALSALVREAGADRERVLELMGKAGKAETAKDWGAGLEIYDQLAEILERQAAKTSAAEPAQADGLPSPGRQTGAASQVEAAQADGSPSPGNRPAPPGGPTAKAGAPEPKAVSPEVAAFKERLKALLTLVAAAGVLPAAKEAKLLGSQAGVASTKADWSQVDSLMKQAEALLGGVKAAPGAPGPGALAKGPTTHTAPVSQKVAFTQTRLAWEETRNHVRAELKKLHDTLMVELKDEPDFPTLSNNANVLYRPLEKLDLRLMDELDAALNANTAEDRNRSHQKALKLVDEYMNFVKNDQLLRDINDNGFVDVDIESVLVKRLTDMAAQLAAAVAA